MRSFISKKTSTPSRIWSQTRLRGTCQAYQLKTVLVREVLRTLQSQPDHHLQNKRYETHGPASLLPFLVGDRNLTLIQQNSQTLIFESLSETSGLCSMIHNNHYNIELFCSRSCVISNLQFHRTSLINVPITVHRSNQNKTN